MKYKDFKLLIEKKVLTKDDYLELRKKLGEKQTKELFEKYIIEEDAYNNEDKFRFIESYYYYEIESGQQEETIEDLDDTYNDENQNLGNSDYLVTDPITQYLSYFPNIPLLSSEEERKIATRMNNLYNTLKERIIYSNEEYIKVIDGIREENIRDIEEILIDNYFNNSLNKLNYPKVLKLKSINKKDENNYSKDTSKDERIKQQQFLKRLLKTKTENLKELRSNDTKSEHLKEMNLLYNDIENIENILELLNMQIEYLDIFNKFFEANIKLAFKLAIRYKLNTFSQIDIIQAANLGLVKAIKKFDPEMGFKFSTYATWWIRQSTVRHISDNERTIRIPVHTAGILNKINNAKKKFEATMGIEPTAKELANLLNLPGEKIHDLLVIDYICNTISLETKVGAEEDSSTLAEFIPNNSDLSKDEVQDTVENEALKEELAKVLSTLTKNESYIIIRRYGLDGEEVETLEELGKELKITRERVRQIEAKALKKLKHPTRSKYLKDFL